MSSLMEEAIVDARALKEAALKNAENVVLEKYSTEVKSALSTLLEQEIEPMPDPMMAPAADEADMGFTDGIPYGFEDEEIDGPAEEEIIEIDFDAIKARLADEEVEGDDLTDALGLADELPRHDELDFSEPEGGDELAPDDEGLDLGDGDGEEEIELSEDMLSGLIEELVLDMTDRPTGWAPLGGGENSVVQANGDAIRAAKAAHLEEDEEEEEVASDVPDDSALFESKNSELTNINKELHALVKESKNQLTKLILENAKLVYQNKALNSASLNERQRVKIVEAVQSANSVEEAKVIYETFQNSVSSPRRKSRRPETLREAVQRPTSLLMSSRESNKAKSDPKMGRMLRLAGLTKK